MAEPGDHVTFSASFAQLDGRLQQAIEVVDRKLSEVVATGDEAMARVLRTELEELKKWASRTPQGVSAAEQTPQIEKATAAVGRENAAKERGVQIDRQSLTTIREQTQALVDQEAVASRLIVARRRGGPYEQLASQQAEVERAAQLRAAAQERLYPPLIAPGQPPVLRPPEGLVPIYDVQRGGKAHEELAGAQAAAEARQRAAAIEREQAQAEADARQRALAIEREQLALDEERVRQQQLVNEWMVKGQAIAASYGRQGRVVPASERAALIAGPQGADFWGPSEQGAQRAGIATAEYARLTSRASTSTEALTTNMTRLGMVEAESSNALRRHGALTTEYLAALARGETTVREFGYQLGATIGKFAGWTAAAAAVYGTIGIFSELRKGAEDGSSGVQRLRRTINDLDTTQARQAIESLSQDTNVSVKESSDAIFQYSRVFHTLGDATTAAHYGLAVLKLDNVSLTDSVALSTGIHQQWGRTAEQLIPIWNMLAAGQREYNARISQTTTILRGAQAAVRQAGGDLNQLVQLSVLGAQALPGQPGQIATALSRSATTYARQNLPVLQAQFGIGQGMTASTYNFTQLFTEAIRRAPLLGPEQRQEMARLFFDPRLAARVGAAYFTPQAAQTLAREQTGREAITPAGTRHAIDEELSRELSTFGQRLSSVTNEIQRMGTAIGASGVISLFGHLIDVFGAVGGEVRRVVDVFDTAPDVFKQAAEAMIGLRLAMLFLTRTRFGATLAEATGIGRLPGFGGTGATLARGELRTGTRAALDTVTADLTQTNVRLLQNSSQMAQLKAQQVEIDKVIAAEEAAGNIESEKVVALKETGSQTLARITALERTQTRLEIERNAQLEVQANLQAQSKGLSSRSQFSDAEVLALQRQTSLGTQRQMEQAGLVGASASVNQRLADQKAALADATEAEQAANLTQIGATGRLAAIQARGTSAWRNLTGRQSTVVRRVLEASGATEEEIAAVATSTAATTGLATRLGGLAAAVDPWVAAIVAIPIGIGAVSKILDDMKRASEQAKQSLTQAYPGDPASALRDLAKAREDALKKPQGGIGGFLQSVSDIRMPITHWRYGDVLSIVSGQAPTRPRQPTGANPISDAARRLAPTLLNEERSFRQDAEGLSKTREGRARLAQAQRDFESLARGEVQKAFAGHPGVINNIMGNIASWAQITTQDIRRAAAHDVPSQLEFLAGLGDKSLQGWAKMYSTRSQVYGLQGGDLSGAIGATLLMAGRYRKSSDPTQIQALQTAEQSVITAVSRQAQNWIEASKTAGSSGAALKDLSQSAAGIQAARNQVRRWVERMRRTYGNVPGFMKAINEVARDLLNQLSGLASNALSQTLSDIQTQSALAASRIGGIGPEADIARAQRLLNGLKPQIAAAKKGGDWQRQADLQRQYNDDARSLQKQRFDNAQSLADANAQVAEAQITGQSPEAEIARARIVLARARAKVAADKAAGVGQAQTAADYAAMLNDQNTLNQDIKGNADQIFDANQQFLVSRITGVTPADDLARARQLLTNAGTKLARDRALGKGQAVTQADYNNMLDQQRAVNEQLQSNAQQTASDAASLIQARAQLQEASTLDPVRQAREQLAADLKVLATIKPGAYKTYAEYQAAFAQQQAKVVTDRRSITQQYVDTQMQTLQFELQTQKISDAQYVAGLERLLKMAKLTQQQRQTIQQAIFGATHAEAVNLNVGDIRLPTSYEVRRSIQAAMRRAAGTRIPQNTGTVINHHVVNHVSIQVRADKSADLKAFADVLDGTLKSNFTGQAQAAGLI